MIRWCGERGFDLTLIETMPMGDIDGDRTAQYLPLSVVRADLRKRWTLTDIDHRTGGPARYMRVAETGGRLGLHHADDPQLLRILQPCPADLYGHALHVPWPGGCRGP